MKKLIFLMLLFTGLTGFASPPVIQNPTPLQYCDPNNDGFGAFDLTTKISEVLGALNPNLFTVTFHETQLDAQLNSNAIPTPALYLNINPNTQTIYIRVEEIADASSYSVTTLDLIINAAPNIGTPLDLSIEQIPFTGTAVFDLTTNDVALINGMTGVTITYYTTQSNAETQTAPILPVTSFSGTNGQIIWARVELATTQCASFASFHLYITNPNIVFIPDANFKAKLIALGVDTNADGNIQQSEATGVFSLDVTNSNIADLTGIQYFSNLNSLDCSNNQLTSLNVSNFIFNTFKCTGNALTSLIANNTRAFQFYCDSNNLTTLDLSTAIINQLYCNNNQLSNLIMTNSSISFELHCDNNQLTSIPATSGIQNLWCGNNLFSSLDLSGWTNLTFLNCSNMPSLAGLYIKNGRNESVTFDTNSNLEFICADESQLQVLQAMASGSSILISTYCSFTPGGNYNTVNGIVRYDSNTNGCDSSDIPMSFFGLGISLDTISTESSIYTNNSGNYTLYMSQAGSYTLNPNLENPNYFIISPTVIDATTINNTTTVQDICILPNGIHPDVEVVIAPISRARPGFDARYQLVYKNKGNQTLSGNVTFTYDDTVLDFLTSDVLPNGQSAGLLSYNYTNLLPFENRSVYITLHVNAPTDTPAVNIDDQLGFDATVNPIAGDDNPSDNTFQFKQIVVGSFDPNDITCIEGNVVPPAEIGNYLHYVINFENTGTADAENIVVREVIDTAQFDINSLQILNSSDSVKSKVTGNKAEFIFQNINLHSGGHGNILIKIKSKNTLAEGDSVSKKADIYFDYNFPVETLPANTIFQQLSNPDFENDASISVYPNPTNGNVNINCNNTIKSVQLYDLQGRLLQTNLVNENQTNIDISSQSNGIYFLKIISDKGIGVAKIMKE